MSTLAIVLIVLLVVVVALALLGALARARRDQAGAAAFEVNVAAVNRELAAAHAQDRGWEPARVEAVAREAFAASHPGVEPITVQLVQVIDPPGTDDDKAVFRVVTADGEHDVRLGRVGGEWIAE